MIEKIMEEIEEATRQEDAPIYCGNMEVDGYVRMSRVEEIIRKHMNDGWIPVEKALPEYGKKVLAYGKSGEIDIASLYSRDKHMWLVGSMCSVAFDIVAWRTLPAPYRQERSDNHDGE